MITEHASKFVSSLDEAFCEVHMTSKRLCKSPEMEMQLSYRQQMMPADIDTKGSNFGCKLLR